jgi:class 3 adenylate cyclase
VIKERTRRLMARNISKNLSILLLIGALFALGLYHLMLLGRRKEFGVYGTVGGMALAFAAHAAVVHGWGTFLPLEMGYQWRAGLEPALALCASYLVLAALHRLLDREVGSIGKGINVALLGGAALSLLPGSIGLAIAGSPLQGVMGLVAIGWAVSLFARGSWSHHNGPPILIGVGALIAASVYDAVAEPALPAAYVGLLAFVLSIAVALGRHFRRTLVELDVRNAQLQKFNDAANRFVPGELLNLIGRDSVVDVVRGDQRQMELTVMFSDVRGFTTLAEARTPGETMDLINRYLQFMEDHVHNFEGAIGSFLGDGVMALYYGGPDKAVQSAIAQLEALKEFNVEQVERGDTPLKIGIGFNTGNLMLGTVGGHDRLDCSVIGDAVNLAARIEGLTKRYGAEILISQSTYDKLEDPSALKMREVDRVVVKGKTEPMTLFEVIDGLPEEARAQRLASLDAWNDARGRYLKREFTEAAALFAKLGEAGDVAGELYAERCVHLAKMDIEPDWDGTFVWTVK